MIRRFVASALIAGASLIGTGGWMVEGPYPVSITLSPSFVMGLVDQSPPNTLVSTATVKMSDGSPYTGQLLVSDPQFAAQGLQIVTAVSPLTPDGQRNITITVN